MFANWTTKALRVCSRFARDTSGNLTVVFALTLVSIITGVGAAVDYSKANQARSSLQAALDAAVLAGAGDRTANWKTTAANTFNGNFVPKTGTTVGSPSFVDNGDKTYSGNATASVQTSFMSLIGVKAIPISAKATAALAAVATGGKASCVISLNATAQKALAMSGSAAVNAPNCTVQVNSNNTDAVDMSGSTKITSAENCFVGHLKTYSSLSVSPSPDAVCTPWSDPFASMTKPTVGSCDHTNYSAAAGENLQPGVYCGGLTISSKTVSFAPGLFIIKDGDLNASGTSRLTGTGVSFFLTGNGAGVTTSGGSTYRLTAMSTGPLASFVFYLDPSSTPANKSVLSGGSEIYFEGVLYFGKQFLELSGGSAGYTTAPFTAYIADTYTISGSSALNINSDPSKTSLPIPSALLGSQGSKLRLMY